MYACMILFIASRNKHLDLINSTMLYSIIKTVSNLYL